MIDRIGPNRSIFSGDNQHVTFFFSEYCHCAAIEAMLL